VNTKIEKPDGTAAQGETLSLRDLRSFVAVARAGGVTRAARELGYAQATLSTHLTALENAMGVPLIEPERRGAPLTEAGRAVLARAEALLHGAAALHGAVRSAAGRATVRLAACEPVASHRLPPLLAGFSREHPDIDVELRVAGHVTGPALVEAGDVDFAIAPKPTVASRMGASVSFTPLYEEPMLVLVPTGHRLAQAKAVNLADLRGNSLLVGNDACTYRALIVGALRESDVEVALRARLATGRRSCMVSPPDSASPFFPPAFSLGGCSRREPSRSRCAAPASRSGWASCRRDGAMRRLNLYAPCGVRSSTVCARRRPQKAMR